MAFNLVEAEGLQDVWDLEPEPSNRKAIDTEKDYTKNDMSLALERFHEPDDYICWRGARIGDSIQALAY
jgi:hypothetical protein